MTDRSIISHNLRYVKSLCVMLFVTAALTACKDDKILQAGAQLSADGKAVASSFAEYMVASADVKASICELSAFETMLAVRKPGAKAQDWERGAIDCEAEKKNDQVYATLLSLANDARQVAAAYAALSRLTDEDNADALQQSLAHASEDIAKAAKTTVNPKLGAALGVLSQSVVRIKDAKGVEAFAKALRNVPDTLRAVLEDDANARFLAEFYRLYDQKVSDIRDMAYQRELVDATVGTEHFVARLGFALNLPNRNDPFFAAFARKYIKPRSVAEAGIEGREKLVEALKDLAAETNNVINIRGTVQSRQEDLADLRNIIKTIKGVVHPE